MSAHTVFRHRNHALLMALAAVYPMFSYAAVDARIDFVSGNVVAVDASGASRPLSKGVAVGTGDTIRTGEGGRAQVRFSDGALVSLQPQTDFRIDNYRFDGKQDGNERGLFSLIKGGMRTLTGLIGKTNRDNYKVQTSVATIGIRGTFWTGLLRPPPPPPPPPPQPAEPTAPALAPAPTAPSSAPASAELLVHTGDGAIEVCNAAGCTVIAAGESGVVTSSQSMPRRTDSRPQLPPPPPAVSVQPIFSSGDSLANDLKIPTSPMPTTGSATYGVIVGQGAGSATLTSGSVSANFGSLTTSINLSGSVAGLGFTGSGSGSISGNTIPSTSLGAFSGTLCGSGCSGSVSGTFYGTGAQQVGINYSVSGFLASGSGSATLGK